MFPLTEEESGVRSNRHRSRFVLALLAALPGDFARRGGSGQIVGLGSVANTVLPGLMFWAGSQTGLARGFAGFLTIIAAMVVGNVLADQVASRVWGPVAAARH